MVRMFLPLAFAGLWVGSLALLFWYPFDFRMQGAFLHQRLHDFLTRVPFQAYYYGTEFRAATEVLHKVLFFIPLGASLAWSVSRLRWAWRGYGTFLSLAMIACTALVISLGRLALPEKNPDSIDIILQWAGGALGFGIFRAILSRTSTPRRTSRTQSSFNRGRRVPVAQHVARERTDPP